MARASTDPAEIIANRCLAVRVRLLNRTVSGIYDEALRPIGMTAGQLNVLVVVARRGPIGQSEVGRILNMEKSTSSRNIERMKRNRWLSSKSAASGRGHVLQVTAIGRRQLVKALPLWQQAQDEAEAVLGPRGAKSLAGVADGVWARLDAE